MSTTPEVRPIPDFSAEQVTLRLKGEYRRSCLYVVLGVTLAGMLSIALDPGRPWQDTAAFTVVFVPAAVLWLFVQTWRLRIDGRGLARRRLGCWSYWSWNHFLAGHVSDGDSSLSFRCSARPWWDRWLLLECVEPVGAAKELERMLRVLIPPLPADTDPERPVAIPAEITLGLGLLGHLHLHRQGIEVRRRRESRQFGWADVLILRLIREQVQHAIAHRLELHLRTGDAISGHVNSVRIDGRRIAAIGHRGADWPERLASLTPPRCWQVFRTFGNLQSSAEGEFRLAHWRKKLTTTRRMRAVLPPLFLALGGIVFMPKLLACWNAQFFPPWWKTVALICLVLMMVQPSFMIWAILQYSAQIFDRKIRETEEEMSRLVMQPEA